MLYEGYNVLERDKMSRILEEQALAESDEVEYEGDTEMVSDYSKVGKLLGVDFIITGSVIQYQYELTPAGNVALAITITARIVECRGRNVQNPIVQNI